MTSTNRFYVYAYLREDGTPYYIGKGCGNRIFAKHKKHVRVPSPDRCRKLLWDVDEKTAFRFERQAIAYWGRKLDGSGILINISEGGEGISGVPCTEETRKKLSDIATGRVHAKSTKAKMSASGKKYWSDPVNRKAQSARLTGRKRSPEVGEKVSKALTGKKRETRGWVKTLRQQSYEAANPPCSFEEWCQMSKDKRQTYLNQIKAAEFLCVSLTEYQAMTRGERISATKLRKNALAAA